MQKVGILTETTGCKCSLENDNSNNKLSYISWLLMLDLLISPLVQFQSN